MLFARLSCLYVIFLLLCQRKAFRNIQARDIDPFLGFPPDADGNGNYAFFDAANYALIQMTGGVTAISAV